MQLKKLQREEHIRTRELWEDIFVEDTPEFLDYYYSLKTQNNEIYVIEDAGKIVSMLHLNPYQMRIDDQIYRTHYIVAVATDEKYRNRGLMRRLLTHVMQVMVDRGEPFTFLMPAAEAIYKPFGFEFVYEQAQGRFVGKQDKEGQSTFEEAKVEDCQMMADFANTLLKVYDVVTFRDADYYRKLFAEQNSENGGILLAKQNDSIVGIFCYAREKEIIFREPIFDNEELLQHAIYQITGNETEEVSCIGYGDVTKPMIMAKALNPECCPDLKKVKVFINEVV